MSEKPPFASLHKEESGVNAAKLDAADDAGATFVLESKGTDLISEPDPKTIWIRHRVTDQFVSSFFEFLPFLIGKWYHAGFHLTTAIVGPTVLTLPYALRGMGWGLGLTSLTVVFFVTYYNYALMSMVLDHCESRGRRHIRFREMASDILGSYFLPYSPSL